ncbi:hypothetical protein CKJ89_38080, partial [Klebsiella pneumoniae]
LCPQQLTAELLALAATRGLHVHYGYPVETLSAESIPAAAASPIRPRLAVPAAAHRRAAGAGGHARTARALWLSRRNA